MKLVSIPANPVPEDVVTGALKTPDGVELRFARWAPPAGRKGTVCVLPGRAEFIEKYFETVRDLRARGFAVAILDWRGQGLSQRALKDPRKGHIRDFAEYATDLDSFMEQIVLPDCPPPFFALAHSMGGAVLINACAHGRRWFDRIVLSAPLIGLPRRRFGGMVGPALRLVRMLGRGTAYIPQQQAAVRTSRDSKAIGKQDFIGNVLTSDPVRYARNAAILEEEPALGLGLPTIAWADSALRLTKKFAEPQFANRIRQPILIAAAGRDEVVSTPAIESFATQLLAGSHIIVAGAKHEILQEQDHYRQQFWAAFDAFVPGTPVY